MTNESQSNSVEQNQEVATQNTNVDTTSTPTGAANSTYQVYGVHADESLIEKLLKGDQSVQPVVITQHSLTDPTYKPILMNRSQAAAFMGVSENIFDQYRKDPDFKVFMAGKTERYTAAALTEFVNTHLI